MGLYEKLNRIQTELKAPKGQYNKFGKYYYRNCEDTLEALKPLLKETNTALVITDEIKYIGNRFYVEATATLYDCDEDTVFSISNKAYAREDDSKKGMDASQVTGASSSYARKYALNGLFAIDDTRDADSRDNREEGTGQIQGINMNIEEEPVKKLTPQHLNVIIKACANAKFDGDAEQFWRTRYHVDTLADIPDADYDFMLTSMKCDKYGNYKG